MSAPASPAPVWEVINGLAAYQALVAALDLGLFDALAERGADGAAADALATRIGAADPDRVAVLADLLVSLGLLDAAGPRYRLTAVAERYLVSGSPATMADLVRLSPGPPAAWADLAETMRTGTPAIRVDDDPAAFLAPLVEATAPTQRAVAAAVAGHLVDGGHVPADAVIVDLGAGSGAWCSAFLGVLPGARAVAVDLAGVAGTTRRMTDGLGGRIEVVVGDYLDVPVPDRADVVVLGHVLRSETPARAAALVARAVALAGSTGTVVVADYPRPEPAAADDPGRADTLRAARHELTLALTMLASTPGAGVTAGQVRAWAGAVGAEVVERLEPLPRQHVLLLRAAATGALRAATTDASPTHPTTTSTSTKGST